jgi:hypothetical protein
MIGGSLQVLWLLPPLMFFHLTNVKISLKILIGGKNIFYLEDKISTIGE